MRARAACTPSPELAARLRAGRTAAVEADLGAWYGNQGQFACANEAFRAALKLDPRSAKVNYFLGASLYGGGDAQGALAPLQRASELDGRALQPRVLLATVLGELNRPREAEAQWKAALAIDPASPDVLDGFAKQLIADRDFYAAIELLRNARRNEDLALDLASAYGFAGELDEAAATVKAALAADPSSVRLTTALVTVYVHQEKYQDAVALLRVYLGGHPADLRAQVQYLGALVLTNDKATAGPLGAKLLTTLPHDPEVLYLNGILEREAEAFEPARTHLREAVALKPDDPSMHYNLGATLAHLNDPKGAQAELEAALRLDPSLAEAHFQLASVLRSEGDASGAQAELATYQGLKRSNAVRAEADSKAHQAREKMAGGDAAGAAELYRQAVAATPENALLQYQYALSLDAAKKPVEEKAALEKAVSLDPTFALAANQLGYVDSASGDNAGAETNFRRAVKAAPEFAAAWINLAATLAAESHMAEAGEAVATALKLEPGNPQALALRRQLAAATQAKR